MEDARGDELGGDIPVGGEALPLGSQVAAQRPLGSDEATGTTGTARTPRRFLIPALVAGLVIALATAGVFGALYLTAEISDEDVATALAEETDEVSDVAGTVSNLLLNYNSTNLDQVAEQMLEVATGNFAEQYEEVLSQGAGLGEALEEASASSQGSILEGPDIYYRSPSEAIAIVRVTQTAQSNSNPGGQTIDYVLKITMVDTEGAGWKADRVEVLSTQQV